MATATRETIVDLREVAPHARGAVALYTSCLLRPGQSMQMIDDHDPADLRPGFQAEPARFGWHYLERGPAIWRVCVTRNAPSAASARANEPQGLETTP